MPADDINVTARLTGAPWWPSREQPIYAYLCGCGAIYSSLTRISSGIFASRRMMVFTITQVLHRALSDVSAAFKGGTVEQQEVLFKENPSYT